MPRGGIGSTEWMQCKACGPFCFAGFFHFPNRDMAGGFGNRYRDSQKSLLYNEKIEKKVFGEKRV